MPVFFFKAAGQEKVSSDQAHDVESGGKPEGCHNNGQTSVTGGKIHAGHKLCKHYGESKYGYSKNRSQIYQGSATYSRMLNRGDRIRTCGLCVPNAALYQTEPRLDLCPPFSRRPCYYSTIQTKCQEEISHFAKIIGNHNLPLAISKGMWYNVNSSGGKPLRIINIWEFRIIGVRALCSKAP